MATLNGRALLVEPDHGTHVVATPEQDTFHRILEHRRSTFRHPLIGRSLVELALAAGFDVAVVRVVPLLFRRLHDALAAGGPFGVAVTNAVDAGAITAAEAARYTDSLTALDERGAFFFGANAIAVLATKPAA